MQCQFMVETNEILFIVMTYGRRIPLYQVVQGNYPLVDQQIELGNNRTSCMLYKGAYTDTHFFNNSKKTAPRFVILNL